jgi:hypothetical protein
VFEKFTTKNYETFKQRYEGTYGFYRKEDRSRMLVRLETIGDRRCVFIDSKGVEFELAVNSERNIGFEFIPPKSNWYNSEDGNVYLVSRLAQRQWQRGISPKNTAVHLLSKGRLWPARVEFDTLDAIYNRSIMPRDAVERLHKGEAFALSNHMAVANGSLFLYGDVIGSVKTADNVLYQVKLTEPDLWRTEVTDAFIALGKTVEVS